MRGGPLRKKTPIRELVAITTRSFPAAEQINLILLVTFKILFLQGLKMVLTGASRSSRWRKIPPSYRTIVVAYSNRQFLPRGAFLFTTENHETKKL